MTLSNSLLGMSLCFLVYHNAPYGPLVGLDKVLTMVVPAKAIAKAKTQPRSQVHSKISIWKISIKLTPPNSLIGMSVCFLDYHNAPCGLLVDLDTVLTMVVPAKAAQKARTQPRSQVHFKKHNF